MGLRFFRGSTLLQCIVYSRISILMIFQLFSLGMYDFEEKVLYLDLYLKENTIFGSSKNKFMINT